MINDKERAIIIRLKEKGYMVSEIAKETGRTIDSIKSFLKREKRNYGVKCLNCGEILVQPPHHAPRIFCCHKCALEFRNKTRSTEKIVKKVCAHCGKEFYDEPGSTQRFCSRRCAGLSRYGK